MYKSKEDKAAYAKAWRAKHPLRGREANRRYRAKNPGAARKKYLQTTYGLTLEAFSAMLAGQNGRCAICETDTPDGQGWCVDHDHDSGKVRNILCHSCNAGIGLLKDDLALVLKAAEYLRRHNGS